MKKKEKKLWKNVVWRRVMVFATLFLFVLGAILPIVKEADAGDDFDWAWSSGSGGTGNLYRTGDVSIGTASTEANFKALIQGDPKGLYVKTSDNTYEAIVGQCHHNYRPAGFVLENRYPVNGAAPRGVMMRFKGMDTNGVMQEYLAFIAEFVTKTAGAIDGDCWIRPVKNGGANWAFRFTHDGKLLIKDGGVATDTPGAALDVEVSSGGAATIGNSGCVATNNYAIAMGYSSTASGPESTAMGKWTNATGPTSTAMGLRTTASHLRATAMGHLTVASGEDSTAIGTQTTASGRSSMATGKSSLASGDYSTTLGLWTTASKYASTAMGYSTIASGEVSTAMGIGTIASGNYSTAMGDMTTASGTYSTAMGYATTASGDYATTMGWFTTASGILSTAIGSNINVSGDYSVGIGLDTTSSYTVADDNVFCIMGGWVGIGTNNPTDELHVNGDIYCTGKLTSVGGNDPPYVLYNNETRHAIIERVAEEVPENKQDGAVLFWNGETSQFEIYLPSKGEFQDILGNTLE